MRLLAFLLIVCMGFTNLGVAQNTNDKQIKIKIESDDGERTIVIDTSFRFEGDHEKLKELMEQFDFGDNMDFNMNDGNIEIFMQRHDGDHRQMMIIGGDPEDAKHAFLGVYLIDPEEGAAGGAHITQVIEGTAAEKASLQAGDIITKANGTAVANKEELIEIIRSMKPEDQLSLTYLRDGKSQQTTATLGAKKARYSYSFGSPGMSQGFIWNQDCDKVMKSHAYLGVYVKEQEEGDGVVITNIVAESAAEAAGLQEDDVITGIDGKSISTSQELIDAIRSKEIGDEITVTYKRDGQSQVARATLGEKKMMDRHAFGGHHFNRHNDLHKQLEELQQNLDQLDKEELHRKLEELKEQLGEPGPHGLFFGPGKGDADFSKMVIIIEMDDVTEEEAADLNLSTDNNLEVEDLSFSPNPGNGQFNLSFTSPDEGDLVINILDINGRSVYQEVISDFAGNYHGQIDISGEADGVYFLQLLQNDKSLVKKIVIQ